MRPCLGRRRHSAVAPLLVCFLATTALAHGGARDRLQLLLRLKPGLDTCVDCLARSGRSLGANGLPGLEALARDYRVRSIRPLRRRDAALDSLAARLRAARGRRSGDALVTTYVLELPPGTDVDAAARAFAADPAVEIAEPDRVVHVDFVPNDPYLASSGAWGQAFPDLWGILAVSAPAAWDVTRGNGVVVAIIDTGIDGTHPDITANLWVNSGEIPDNGVDDDGNGFVDDVHGWNFFDDDGDTDDDYGHGTHVAGTVAAVGDNGLGVVGVAFESRVMAVKGFGPAGLGYESDLAESILYAIDNGAQVINASWGGALSVAVRDALAAAHAAGVVIAASAGNDGADLDDRFTFRDLPATSPHVITVGAITHLDERAAFSDFGTKIDVVAPGGGDGGPATGGEPDRSVLSLRARNAGEEMTGNGQLVVTQRYVRQAGTSMAAPHVSGAAALLLALRPGMTPELVRQALRAGADDLGAPGFDTQFGYGRLDVARALAVEPLVAKLFGPADRMITAATSLDVTGSASGPGFASWQLDRAPVGPSPSWTTITGPVTTPVDDGPLATWDTSAVPDGRWWLRLAVTSTTGVTFEDRVVVIFEHIGLTEPSGLQYLHGGPIVIRGSASPADFVRFTVEQRSFDQVQNLWSAWTGDGMDVTSGGLTPVRDGVLATFDPSALPGSRLIDIRLAVTTTSGPIYRFIPQLVIDPTLRPGWPLDLPSPGFPVEAQAAPTLADLDRDGTTEVLIAWNDLVHAFAPDGSEAPGWPQRVANAGTGQAIVADTGPSAADLDGDGRLEVVVSTRDQVYVFRHDGSLVPGWPRPFPAVNGADCTLADLDGDGRREIVFTQSSVVNAVRLDGASLPGFPVVLPEGQATRFLAVGDVDGDGRRDVVVTAKVQKAYCDCAASVLAYVFDHAGQPKPGWPRKIGKTLLPAYPFVAAPVLADLDRDGVLDIVVNTEKLNKVRAYRGDGRRISTLVKLPSFPKNALRNGPEPVTAGDITGDGVPELLLGTQIRRKCQFYEDCGVAYDMLSVITPGSRLGNLPGWPLRLPTYLGDQTHGTGAATVADVDGDGRQEVLIGAGECQNLTRLAYPQCLGVWAMDADGLVAAGFPKPVLAPGMSRMSPPAVGDLDGDGSQEVVWLSWPVRAPPRLIVWNVGSAGAAAPGQWPMARHDAAHTGALTAAP
jgi:subtilisin family serine protease